MADTEQQQQQQQNQHDSHGNDEHRRRPDRDEPIMVKRGETGTVKWFSFKSGYGFIAIDNSDEEVFVHSSSIVTLRKIFCVLHEGDQCEFDVIQGLKGLEAVAVTGLGGKKIGGARFNDRRPPLNNQQQPQGGEKNGGGGGAGKGRDRRRRTTSQENNNNQEEEQGGENGGGEGGGRKQNGGRGPRRGPRGGAKRGGGGGGEKFVDAKESPEGGNN